MEMLWFTLVGLAVYMLSDGILLRLEKRRGKPFENRSMVFFAIFLVLILGSFELIDFVGQVNK